MEQFQFFLKNYGKLKLRANFSQREYRAAEYFANYTFHRADIQQSLTEMIMKTVSVNMNQSRKPILATMASAGQGKTHFLDEAMHLYEYQPFQQYLAGKKYLPIYISLNNFSDLRKSNNNFEFDMDQLIVLSCRFLFK